MTVYRGRFTSPLGYFIALRRTIFSQFPDKIKIIMPALYLKFLTPWPAPCMRHAAALSAACAAATATRSDGRSYCSSYRSYRSYRSCRSYRSYRSYRTHARNRLRPHSGRRRASWVVATVRYRMPPPDSCDCRGSGTRRAAEASNSCDGYGQGQGLCLAVRSGRMDAPAALKKDLCKIYWYLNT